MAILKGIIFIWNIKIRVTMSCLYYVIKLNQFIKIINIIKIKLLIKYTKT